MEDHPVVSKDEWLVARMKLLDEEKKLSRMRDQVSAHRLKLPWTRIEKDYVFEGADGKETLAELFNGRSQLIVYHFMFGAGWGEGCKACSFLVDHINGTIAHLKARDVTLLAVSHAPFAEFQPFKKRMGWRFKWVSSHDSEFNTDFNVSFSKDELEAGEVYYNYKRQSFPSEEAPGLSSFFKDDSGQIFHTYSCYARGLDQLIGTYNFLDLSPNGRDEDNLSYTMEWVRHHDRYET